MEKKECTLKYGLGYVEIAASVLTALCFVLLHYLETLIPNASMRAIFEEYISFPYLLLAVISVLFGSTTGALSGFAGMALYDVIFLNGFSWGDALEAMIFGLILGFFCDHFKAREGHMGKREMVDFGILLSIDMIIVSALFRSVEAVLRLSPNLLSDVGKYLKETVGVCLFVGIVGAFTLRFISFLIYRFSLRKGA